MKKGKIVTCLGTVVLLTSMTANTVFGGWAEEGEKWRYQNEQGQSVAANWIQDGESRYRMDENGYMKIGWFQENGTWYFLDTRIGGPQGRCLTGWQWIDGRCYYLDPIRCGAMTANGRTPDGYQVDSSGAWVDETGTPHIEVGKGISSTQVIDITAAGPGGAGTGTAGSTAVSSGGSGGGGSSSGGSSSSSNIYEDSEWDDYAGDELSGYVNDFKNGNAGMMTASQKRKVEEAIEDFQDTYLTDDMTDFEVELKIIQWLVANCSYKSGDGWEYSTAYSCIVNGKAQCAGYADAFLQVADACGLEARYICSKNHAWNLVELDGDWYHVDVTWEDPKGSNTYGFGNLRNKYINLEDSEIKNISSHHSWSPSTIKAKGTKYGHKVVAQYMKDGTVDPSNGESFDQQVENKINSIRNSDGSNVIAYTCVDDAAEKIVAYLSTQIETRKETYVFALRYLDGYSTITSGDYSKAAAANRDITAKVVEAINNKYGSILRNDFSMHLLLEADANGRYYVLEDGNLNYKEGQGKMIPYTVHYIEKKTGKEIGTQIGSTEKQTSVRLQIPDGYLSFKTTANNYKINSGKINYTGYSFTIKSDKAVDLNIMVEAKGVSAGAPIASPSSATAID